MTYETLPIKTGSRRAAGAWSSVRPHKQKSRSGIGSRLLARALCSAPFRTQGCFPAPQQSNYSQPSLSEAGNARRSKSNHTSAPFPLLINKIIPLARWFCMSSIYVLKAVSLAKYNKFYLRNLDSLLLPSSTFKMSLDKSA